jgi:hypothetical protein
MADNTRTPRSTETREATARRKPWAPPSRLDSPQAPEGYVHRWIRVAMRGEEDKTNVFSKLREARHRRGQVCRGHRTRWSDAVPHPCRNCSRKIRVLRAPDPRTDAGCRSGLDEGPTSFDADFR